MACFKPLRAFKLSDGSVVFSERGDIVANLWLPCGSCVGCRMESARQWSVRIMHEASLYENNCFITLTYDDLHMPADHGLHYGDFQAFMRDLRRTDKVRFFMCGEYGSLRLRPHFHACLFGVDFPDLVPWKRTDSDGLIYRSARLEKLWPKGFSSVGELTAKSAAYVARYSLKKKSGKFYAAMYDYLDESTGEIFHRVPEFVRMSLKPGIGRGFFDKYHNDIFPHDRVIVNGTSQKPPKYYSRLFQFLNPDSYEDLQFARYLKGLKFSSDNSDDRLSVREQVVKARISHLKRGL
ncbi:MAG: replication initiator protein [Microviridae sp.]|nr:MAG: replication initiator protein [Microviridae sp.]